MKLEADELALLPPGATILHWEFQHFVVLARVGPTHVEIVDPARRPPRAIPMDEFRRAFTGVALIFEPTDLFRAGKPRRRRWSRPSSGWCWDRGCCAGSWSMSLVLQVFGLALPVLTGQVIDRVLPRGDLRPAGGAAGWAWARWWCSGRWASWCAATC